MHSWYRRITMWMLAGSLLLAGNATLAKAGEPQEKIRQTVNDVLTVLSNKALQPQERRTQIRQTVLQRFGFEEMAKRSLARHWQTLNPQQRQEFVELFTDLLERSYINRIEGYSGGPDSVRYIKEDLREDTASVQTEIRRQRDLSVQVEYRLLRAEGDWKVYDIVIEGVSLVNNYRTQFNTIMAKDSYAGLVKQMRLKLEQEKATAPQQG